MLDEVDVPEHQVELLPEPIGAWMQLPIEEKVGWPFTFWLRKRLAILTLLAEAIKSNEMLQKQMAELCAEHGIVLEED